MPGFDVEPEASGGSSLEPQRSEGSCIPHFCICILRSESIPSKADNKFGMSLDAPPNNDVPPGSEPAQKPGLLGRLGQLGRHFGRFFQAESTWTAEELAHQVEWRIRRAYGGGPVAQPTFTLPAASQSMHDPSPQESATSQPESVEAFLRRYAHRKIERTYGRG